MLVKGADYRMEEVVGAELRAELWRPRAAGANWSRATARPTQSKRWTEYKLGSGVLRLRPGRAGKSACGLHGGVVWGCRSL